MQFQSTWPGFDNTSFYNLINILKSYLSRQHRSEVSIPVTFYEMGEKY